MTKVHPLRPPPLLDSDVGLSNRVVFVCLSLMLAVSVFASDAPVQYRLDAWTTDNGLPDNSIKALCQTRDGYLWLTTGDGLVRFDGLRFRVFNKANTPALTTNRFSFFSLLEDRQGALWAGTEFGGVVRYRDGVFTCYTTREGLPDNKVLRIDEDDQGTIWIFTAGGLAQWKNERLVPIASDPGSFRRPLDTPANLGVDRIFFGLWHLDGGGWSRFAYGRWTRLPLPPHLTDSAKLHIDSIVEDSRRRLWFHLATRPAEYYCIADGRLAVFHDVGRAGEAFVTYQDRLGRLLVSDHNGRVTLWKDGHITPLPGLSTPSVLRALEDREGQLWIGTKNEGLYRIREQVMTVYRHPGGPEFNAAQVMLQDRAGDIWFGSSSGLTRFSTGRFKNYYRPSLNRPHGNVVYGLYEDSDGAIWVSSGDGIARFKDGRFLEERKLSAQIKDIVFAIHRDRRGNLWLGGVHGLSRLRDDSLRHYGASDGLTGGTARVIYEDRAGTLWFGTDGGLSHLTGSGFVSFTSAEGLSSGSVRSLHEDDQGIMWVGTVDGGLTRLAAGRDGVKLTRYTTKDGLYNNSVYQILEDDLGFFWISCHLGIYRVSKQELNDFAAGRVSEITSTHFKADDLSNLAFSGDIGQPAGFKAPDGKLWFATLGGVATVDPHRILLNPVSPPVVIEECILDRQPLDSRYGLRIAPGRQNLEINYTGLSFIKSNQIRFKYQMEGLDDNWIDAGTRRTAYYSHVPPGQYTFRVIAANSDGVWNRQGTSLSVVVLPAFYQTWWFTALAIFSGVGLMLLIYHRRVAQLHKAQAAQEAFSKQLIDSQESERKRIAAELHDSLGQNLLIIKNHAVIGSMTEPGAQCQFDEIAASATQSIEEVRQIAYNLRPHHLDRLGLTQALEAMIEKVAASTPIHFTSELVSIDGLFPKEAEITVFRVIQESISNIVKHSQAGDAKVKTERESGVVTITIEDNGRGFTAQSPRAASNGGFGLVGISERVRILGGQQAVQSAPGQGTTIIIKLPTHSPAKERRNGQ